MQKTFAIIISLLSTFIFMLCAIEPIIVRPMASEINEIDENKLDILVLSTEPQTYKSVEDHGKVYLYLDSDTPLTVRYMMENKDYYLNFSSFKWGVCVYLGDEENYIYHATSDEVSITLNYLEFEPAFKLDSDSSRWDKPIVVSGFKTIMPTDFVVSASESYREDIVKDVAELFPTFWDCVRTVINFIVSNPIVLICVGVAFVGSAIALSKRVRY